MASWPPPAERELIGKSIERVDGPEPFDLKLTLDRSPRGPRVYYGRSAEGASFDAELARAVE